MNQTDIVNATTQVAQRSRNIVSQQVDRQTTILGGTLAQTARDLEQVGSTLRASGTIGGAAPFADWAADYVQRAADYLATGDTDRFIVDIASFARERPWSVAASAAALGFVAARIVKSSGAQRYESGYASPNAILSTPPDYANAGSSAPEAEPSSVSHSEG